MPQLQAQPQGPAAAVPDLSGLSALLATAAAGTPAQQQQAAQVVAAQPPAWQAVLGSAGESGRVCIGVRRHLRRSLGHGRLSQALQVTLEGYAVLWDSCSTVLREEGVHMAGRPWQGRTQQGCRAGSCSVWGLCMVQHQASQAALG